MRLPLKKENLAPSVDTGFPSLSVSSRTANWAVSGSENKEWRKKLSGHTRKDADDYLLMMMIAHLCVSDRPPFYRLKRYESLRRHSLTPLPLMKKDVYLKSATVVLTLSYKCMTVTVVNNGTTVSTPWLYWFYWKMWKICHSWKQNAFFWNWNCVHAMSHYFSANGHKKRHLMTSSVQVLMV